jgi:hypothetical protein
MIYWIIGGIVAGILLLAIFGDHMIAPIEEKDAHDPY